MPLPNFSQYVPPGVYWAQSPTPVANPVGVLQPTVVAIVGPGIGYRTNTDSVTLTGTVASATPPFSAPLSGISKFGVNSSSVVVTNTSGTVTYSATTDYTITQTASMDGNALDTTTTIARQAGGNITSGQTVVVSYQYTDSTYYVPTSVTNYQQIQALFGAPYSTTTGAILSPLTFAAQFAMDNGATQLVLQATQSAGGSPPATTRTYLSNAYANLAALNNIGIVVPLPVGIVPTSGSIGDVQNIINDLSSFVDGQVTNNNVFQIGIMGYETGVLASVNASASPDVIANTVADPRIIEAWPNQLTYYNAFLNQTQILPGYYLAAAYAGVLAGNPVQQGLTKQLVKDFSGIPPVFFTQMTNAYKNQMSAAGVAVTEISRNGQLQIRHGVTTNTTNVYNREISLVRSQDYMIQTILSAVQGANLIGKPITSNTATSLTGLSTTQLTNLVNQGVIAGFSGLTVAPSTTDPTTMTISYQYLPTYPLNYITISFSINTTTGSVSISGSTSGGTVGSGISS